jgi:hypothetical protein
MVIETGARSNPMERTGIEPVTSGLQTHHRTRHHPTPADQTRMVESISRSRPNVGRPPSTTIRSHRARTDVSYLGNEDPAATQLLGDPLGGSSPGLRQQ